MKKRQVVAKMKILHERNGDVSAKCMFEFGLGLGKKVDYGENERGKANDKSNASMKILDLRKDAL